MLLKLFALSAYAHEEHAAQHDGALHEAFDHVAQGHPMEQHPEEYVGYPMGMHPEEELMMENGEPHPSFNFMEGEDQAGEGHEIKAEDAHADGGPPSYMSMGRQNLGMYNNGMGMMGRSPFRGNFRTPRQINRYQPHYNNFGQQPFSGGGFRRNCYQYMQQPFMMPQPFMPQRPFMPMPQPIPQPFNQPFPDYYGPTNYFNMQQPMTAGFNYGTGKRPFKSMPKAQKI